jgi:hypothetical protein
VLYWIRRHRYLVDRGELKSRLLPTAHFGHLIKCLTSLGFLPSLEVDLYRLIPQWGRHGFDGDACGQEACRGAHTRDRVQNDNCQSTDGIRSLIS